MKLFNLFQLLGDQNIKLEELMEDFYKWELLPQILEWEKI